MCIQCLLCDFSKQRVWLTPAFLFQMDNNSLSEGKALVYPHSNSNIDQLYMLNSYRLLLNQWMVSS